MLVIDPEACIDCGVCVPECPIDAIVPDTNGGLEQWVELNREYAQKWPNITRTKAALPDAEEWKEKTGKYPEHFSPEPFKE